MVVRTGSVRGGLRGSAAGREAGGAVAAGADDVIAGRKQVDAAAEVGATGPERHELVGQVHRRHRDDLQVQSEV